MKARSLKSIAIEVKPNARVRSAAVSPSTMHRYRNHNLVTKVGKNHFALTEHGAASLGWRPNLLTRIWRHLTS